MRSEGEAASSSELFGTGEMFPHLFCNKDSFRNNSMADPSVSIFTFTYPKELLWLRLALRRKDGTPRSWLCFVMGILTPTSFQTSPISHISKSPVMQRGPASSSTDRYRVLMRGEDNFVLVNHYTLRTNTTSAGDSFSYTAVNFADEANRAPQMLRFFFDSEIVCCYFAHKFEVAVRNNEALITAELQ
jgi:hypothetical protein